MDKCHQKRRISRLPKAHRWTEVQQKNLPKSGNRSRTVGVLEIKMDPNTPGVVIGLGSIGLWSGAALGTSQQCFGYGFYRTTFGFFARRRRRFSGSSVHYGTCHDHHRGGVPLGVKVIASRPTLERPTACHRDSVMKKLVTTIKPHTKMMMVGATTTP